jgi:hypothetical protein
MIVYIYILYIYYIYNLMPFTMASKSSIKKNSNKFNLVLKCLYSENYKTLMKEDTHKWRVTYIHGSEEARLSRVHTAQNNLEIKCTPIKKKTNDIFHRNRIKKFSIQKSQIKRLQIAKQSWTK